MTTRYRDGEYYWARFDRIGHPEHNMKFIVKYEAPHWYACGVWYPLNANFDPAMKVIAHIPKPGDA